MTKKTVLLRKGIVSTILYALLLACAAPASAGKNVGLNQADLAFTGFVLVGYASTQIPETDKGSHFHAGMAVGGMTAAITENPYYGAAAAGIVGGLKEAYDRRSGGHVADWEDFGYTLGGGAIAAYLVHLLQQYDETRQFQIYEYRDSLQRTSLRIGYNKEF